MTETVFRVAVAELATIRVTCRACSTTTEVPISKAAGILERNRCRHCDAEISNEKWPSANPLQNLGKAIEMLAEMQDRLGVEFAIPIAAGEK